MFQLNVLGHQFVAQQYYTVIFCSNCHQILYGIGPQGYQCSGENQFKKLNIIYIKKKQINYNCGMLDLS